MADGSEPADPTSAAAEKDEQRAAKARAKEQKRAAKEAAKAQREAELAKLDEETLGKQLEFRVFKDGTVEKEQSSGSAWLQTKLGQSGLPGLPTNPCARSPLVSANLVDNRRRRPFHRARDGAGTVAGAVATTVSGGWLAGLGDSGGGEYKGSVSLTIITNHWTETLSAQADSNVAALLALNLLLQQAKNAPTPSSEAVPQPSVPPPPGASSTPAIDVPGALRELKDLHDEGLLTDDEYEARRQLLVAQLPISAHLPTSAEVSTSAEVNAPAGWHPDPYGTARLRWWDGHAWSEHTAP